MINKEFLKKNRDIKSEFAFRGNDHIPKPKPQKPERTPEPSEETIDKIVEKIRSNKNSSVEIVIEQDVRIFNKVVKEFRGEHHKPRLTKGSIWKIVYP